MSQPTAIQLLADSGCDWKTIIRIVGLARDAQRLGAWTALDIDDESRLSYEAFLARANIDPMDIQFK